MSGAACLVHRSSLFFSLAGCIAYLLTESIPFSFVPFFHDLMRSDFMIPFLLRKAG